VDEEPVHRRHAVRAERLRAVEDVREAVVVRVQGGAVPAAPPRVGHVPLVGIVHERLAGLLDEKRIRLHRGAAVGPDAAEYVFLAVLVEISGLAIVPIDDGTEKAGINRAERAVLIVDPQVGWMPVTRREYVRP